jgi:hypothetical protein
MNRRNLIKLGLGAGLSYVSQIGFAQLDLFNVLNPYIWPSGKSVDYSVAQSPLVQWAAVPRSYPPNTTTTYGFLEGLATESVLPVILQLNIGTIPKPWFGRDESAKGVPEFPRSGLYVAFEVGAAWCHCLAAIKKVTVHQQVVMIPASY